MNKIFISLLLGAAVGVLDIIPMIIQKLNPMFIISAFCFWLVLGFFMPRIKLEAYFWLKGLLISLLTLVPLLSLIYLLDGSAVIKIVGTTAVLGTLLGIISGRLIKE